MATENSGLQITLTAGADLSSYQYRFMTLGSNGKMALTGDGQAADAVLQDKPAADGRAGMVVLDGATKIVAGAATTVGSPVGSDSTGRAVDAASGDFILGKFREAAGAAGNVVSILFYGRPSKL